MSVDSIPFVNSPISVDKVDHFPITSTDITPPIHTRPLKDLSKAYTYDIPEDRYEALLKEILEEQDDDGATREGPEELKLAIEDREIAERYLIGLRGGDTNADTPTRTDGDAFNNIASSTPSTPLGATTPNLTSDPFQQKAQRPLLNPTASFSRVLNGLPSLTMIEQKFQDTRIPELDLPSTPETTIRAKIGEMLKLQDDLQIHLQGGALGIIGSSGSGIKINGFENAESAKQIVAEKRRRKVEQLLDDVTREVGVYEEFVKRGNYLTLEAILNETDNSSDDELLDSETLDTESEIHNIDSRSDISKTSTNTSSPSLLSGSNSNSRSLTPQNPSFLSPTSSTKLSLSRSSSTPSIKGDGASTPPRIAYSHLRGQSPSKNSGRSGTSDGRSVSDILAPLNETADKPNGKEVEPYEAFRWTPLKKISDQMQSESVRRMFGLATVLCVGGVIALGTTRGLVMVFDYSQNLKVVLGNADLAVDVGAVTSLALSSDATHVLCGHTTGIILLWEISKPETPLRQIDPLPPTVAYSSRAKEGHLRGTPILHVGFAGIKKTEIISADEQGMAFSHILYKVVMVNAAETIRILGRYGSLPSAVTDGDQFGDDGMQVNNTATIKTKRPSTVLAMQPMPLGQVTHVVEQFSLVALLTPYKMIVVGLKPSPQTQFKFVKPKAPFSNSGFNKDQISSSSSITGCIAWFPAVSKGASTPISLSTRLRRRSSSAAKGHTDPMLAFSWGNHLVIIQVCEARPDGKKTDKKDNKKIVELEFLKIGEWVSGHSGGIVALQWVNRQILAIFTSTEEMIVFDPRTMQETEHISIRSKQLVYHDRFNSALKDLVDDSESEKKRAIEMAYYHSVRAYKGKLFLLGVRQLFVGTLLSWTDRIANLVEAGDFLEGIALATSFYNGKSAQTVIGLPDDDFARQQIVGEKLMELLIASLNYAFSAERTYDGMIGEGFGGGGGVLFHDLSVTCIEACLSMQKLEFLFDVVYERYCDAGVKGVFLEVLEPYIVTDQINDLPPSLMKDLVEYYRSRRLLTRIEQIIWHVDPRAMDIDQVVGLCVREGLYDAMIYVWNRGMRDYVSPIVEMLKVMKLIMKSEDDFLKPKRKGSPGIDEEEERRRIKSLRRNVSKIFEYLKSILTGRAYPDEIALGMHEADEARAAVYSFVFSGRSVVWPRVGGKLILTMDDDDENSDTPEPTYPYLRLLLRFDARKLLEALEVAFEDSWLNGGETMAVDYDINGTNMSRQLIVNTLLDVMGGWSSPTNTGSVSRPVSISSFSDFSAHTALAFIPQPQTNELSSNLTHLYIFIASNLYKYTTFILLPPSTLHRMLTHLSSEVDPRSREERQIAVQRLLEVYMPTDEDKMVILYEEARFYKVLENVYRTEKKYPQLVETFLNDPERRSQVFDCVSELLVRQSRLTERQRNAVSKLVMKKIPDFVDVDGEKTARMITLLFGAGHEDVLQLLEEEGVEEVEQAAGDDNNTSDRGERRVFMYLRGLLEPEANNPAGGSRSSGVIYVEGQPVIMDAMEQTTKLEPHVYERYVDLMCKYDPTGVYNYLQTYQDNSYRLEKVLPSCERYGIIDAIVWILERSGNATGALEKVLDIVRKRILVIISAINDHVSLHREWTVEEQAILRNSLIRVRGVLKVGIQLCENSSQRLAMAARANEGTSVGSSRKANSENESETLWFRLLDTYVDASKTVLNALTNSSDQANIPPILHSHLITSFKSYVQAILTSLLLSTSSPQVSLPRLLVRLIQSQATPETTFADFRDIFLGMLDTYKYEGQLLAMTNRLFEKDLFVGLSSVYRKRGRGWRPRKPACEICGAAFGGLEGASIPLGLILDQPSNTSIDKDGILQVGITQPETASSEGEGSGIPDSSIRKQLPLHDTDVLLFRCGHGYHRKCLDLQTSMDGHPQEDFSCLICNATTVSKRISRDPLGSNSRKVGVDVISSSPHSKDAKDNDVKGKGRAV